MVHTSKIQDETVAYQSIAWTNKQVRVSGKKLKITQKRIHEMANKRVTEQQKENKVTI